MGRAGLGKRGHPGAGVGTGEAVRAGERGRKRAWEEAEGRVGVRPAAPRSLGAAHGSPGMDDPTLANPQSMGQVDSHAWGARHPKHQPHGSEASVRGGGGHVGPSVHRPSAGAVLHAGNESGGPGHRNSGPQPA